jgi:pimeloyl-ACP methyl ester carboxylesterase
MYRLIFAFGIAALTALAACDAPAPTEDRPASITQATSDTGRAAKALVLGITRDHVTGDIYHYGFTLRVGDTANAKLGLHRVVRESAPWQPRATAQAAMLLHGDFATFFTNFAPSLGTPASSVSGLAAFLAQKDIDVWGLDRRWTQAPAEGADLSDFADMGLVQELDDIGRALAFARTTRLVTGSGAERLTLLGFSRGGQLAYAYTASEADRPDWQRHVKGLVPLDVYAEIAPADEALCQFLCANADYEREALAAGAVDSDNSFFIALGSLARTAPAEPSPLFPPFTNRGALLTIVGQTYQFAPYTPLYHLISSVVENDVVTGVRESPEDAVSAWLAGAAPHQSLRESAESDALWCGQGPLPINLALDRIQVPLFYLGAAGGFGDHGLYSTTRVGSTDVTTLVVRRFGPDREAEDFGHGDLLFANDAPALAWQPLASWILAH